ncbi:dynamin family protein [Tuberibacillus calidus]|uniref:dynamin family protein n=1 Tax=Tuberibacillus calidus TaxID=340097 RepID=UPI0004047EAD|nr:dynamin family protein [Tuberibacillus calidus]
MSFSLNDYIRKRDFVCEKLDRLILILKEVGFDKGVKKVELHKTKIIEDSFQIAVVGEFSRGKSTFINALLGKKILPSLARPTTTILNIISYGDEPSITLYYRDEAKLPKRISEEEFKKIIAPMDPIEGDPDSEKEYKEAVEKIKEIRFADISAPLSFCKDGVTIIDTPGTNDLDPAREQITNNIIPNADAAILLLSAKKILAQSEMSFLRDRLLVNDIQKIFIVINFKDVLDSDEKIEKVKDFTREHLKPILGDTKVFLITAKQALNARRKMNGEELVNKFGHPIPTWDIEDTGILEFEEALSKFLQYERGAIKLLKPIQASNKIIDHVINNSIEFQRKTLVSDIQHLDEKIEAFKPRVRNVRKTGKKALHKIESQLSYKGKEIISWYEKELDHISSRALSVIDRYEYLDPQAIAREIEDEIAPLERTLHLEKKKRVEMSISEIIKLASQNLDQEWDRLNQAFDRLISNDEVVTLSRLSEDLAQDTQQHPDIFDEIFEELNTAWTNSSNLFVKGMIAVGGILAGIIYGGVSLVKSGMVKLMGETTRRKFRIKIINQFETKNKEKVSDLKREWEVLGKALRTEFKKIIETNIAEIENQLNQLRENTHLEQSEIQRKLENLNRQEKMLLTLKQDLQKVSIALNTKKELEGVPL